MYSTFGYVIPKELSQMLKWIKGDFFFYIHYTLLTPPNFSQWAYNALRIKFRATVKNILEVFYF